MDPPALPRPELSPGVAKPLSADALLGTINSLLNRWAAEDALALLVATARGNQPQGRRSGEGAASTVPYVLEAIRARI